MSTELVKVEPGKIEKLSAKTIDVLDKFGKEYENTKQAFEEAKESLSKDGVSKVLALGFLEAAKENKGFSRKIAQQVQDKLFPKNPAKVEAGKIGIATRKAGEEEKRELRARGIKEEEQEAASKGLTNKVFVEIDKTIYIASNPVAADEVRLKVLDNPWALLMTARHKDLILTIDPDTKGVTKIRIE